MQINSLNDVRPGDLCFTRIGGFVPGVVPVRTGMLAVGERVRIGQLSFDHVLVVTQAPVAASVRWLDEGAEDDRASSSALMRRALGPMGVQAMPGGAERIELTNETHWNPWTAFARLPEDRPGQAADAARIAEAMALAEIPYSFGSYLALAAWRYGIRAERLTRHIDRRLDPKVIDLPYAGETVINLPAEAICSVLADQAWSLAGKRVIEGVSPQAVTPGKLGMQLWNRRGVVWGGPGLRG